MEMIKSGIYKHFKGDLYKVLGEGIHTETFEKFVVYESTKDSRGYSAGSIWIRPKEMFIGKVKQDNQEILRFKYIGDE